MINELNLNVPGTREPDRYGPETLGYAFTLELLPAKAVGAVA
jgi:3-dehydroquinate dehydratase